MATAYPQFDHIGSIRRVYMSTTKVVHRGVEFQYAYDINTDKRIGRVTVPEALRGSGSFQTRVHNNLRRAAPGTAYTHEANSDQEIIDHMKAAIDEFLDW